MNLVSTPVSNHGLHIVHIISGLGQGGAEAVLFRLVTAPESSHRHTVISLGGLDDYGIRLRQAGIDVIPLGIRGPMTALRGAWRLWRILRRLRPNVVQTWMYHADLVGGVLARLAGIRAVAWGIRNSGAHFDLASRSSRWAAAWCARLSRRIPAVIVACAHQSRHHHEQWGYDTSRFAVVPNGYDLQQWQPDAPTRARVRKAWGVADEVPVAGFVARWHPLKDHANLIAAMAMVKQSFPDARLVLVGSGMQTDNADLVALLSNHELLDDTLLLGSRNDVPQLMQGLDVHVLASRAEGFPNVVAEAMAAGVANVVTNVGDAAFMVGDTAEVVPAQDAPALAKAIIQVLSQRHTKQAQQLRLAARQRVLEHFSRQAMVDGWSRIWSGLVQPTRLLLVVNNPAFFLSHRLPLAEAARQQGYDVHIASMDGPAVKEIIDLGFPHHVLKMSRSGKHPVRELLTLFGLWRLFRRLRPDLVHAVTIKPVIYGGIAARLARVPALVAAVSGLGYVFMRASHRMDFVRVAATLLYRLALGHPNSRVIFQNQDDLNTLEKLKVVRHEQAVLVRGSGVDLDTYTMVPEPDTPPCVAVCVARLLRDKGVEEFIEAARQSHQAEAPVVWQLVGAPDPGNPTSLSQAYVQSQHEAGVIQWLGVRDDIADIYQRAHVAVLPSYREGLPKSLIEAAACGRAIVTTDVPGCRDAMESGVTGLLVPPRDPTALAEAVLQLAYDDRKRQAMGAAGRRLAESEFGITRIVQEQLDVYGALASPVATPK